MNADAFRHFYGYHFWLNRRIWDEAVSQLSDDQYTQPLNYSRGSIRDQLVHLMNCENSWFSGLRGVDFPEDADPASFHTREAFRAAWDAVEQNVRAYLANLTDDMLNTKPLQGEDAGLYLWQVLLHVVNHGTDHRAQILRQLNDLGVQTEWQDYIFYCYGSQ